MPLPVSLAPMAHHPDFSSTDSEYDDDEFDYDFKERLKRVQQNYQNAEATAENTKERKLKAVYSTIVNGRLDELLEYFNNGIDINDELEGGWTPLLLACSIAHFEIVRALVDKGADVKSHKDGRTTLMLSCLCTEFTTPFQRTSKLVQYLLDKGADPRAIDRKRATAIMYAADSGNLEAVKILLPVSDLNAEDNQKWNVFFWGVHSGNVKVVEFLLEQDFDLLKTDVRNYTALDIAKDNDFMEIMELFPSEHDEISEIISLYSNSFESLFTEINPNFFLDICSILYGIRNECLIKLFHENQTKLKDFLALSEDDLVGLGVKLPYQRNRILSGLFKFHKHNYLPQSLLVVRKNELYTNMDIASAILSAIKQIIAMESSLKFIEKNLSSCANKQELKITINNIKKQIRILHTVINKLHKKSVEWDQSSIPIDFIQKGTKKRKFPWKMFIFGFTLTSFVAFRYFK